MNPTVLKKRPPYAIASVDHALRLATVLQLEGALTVTSAAERLGVARSTAHRVLQMLVYRDFARKDDNHVYHPGPLLELASHSASGTAELRRVALPYLHRLSETFDESINISIRAGDRTCFVATVECDRALRVTSREGMAFPLHHTTTGMLYLASQGDREVDSYLGRQADVRPTRLLSIKQDIDRARRCGFAINLGRSEKGLAAIGVALPRHAGSLFAGLSVSLPSVRYDQQHVEWYVSVLRSTSIQVARELAGWSPGIELAG